MNKYTLIGILFTLLSFGCRSNKEKEIEFWHWFSENQNYYYKLDNEHNGDYLDLTEKLNAIDSNLTFEFSPIHDNGVKEFTISADGIKASFPSVRRLVDKAPKIKNWKINAFRQRVPGDHLSITYDDTLTIAYDDIYFRYGEDEGKLGVELNVRNFKDNPSFNNALFILMDGLIGEYDMETQVGWIERKNLDERKIDSLYRFVELRNVVDSFKNKNKK